ncbi:MAG: oligosaccharide flippase family protein [Muribaculaceae bacterium]|jgi:O-antigen/teichoic acid export membrane protein|nr:oligosaccharide flippase family protein [Muribaculaceae bacterium]
MAANLKSLAKDTAIYGMSSIIGRFLNYLLVPLYTAKLSAASGGYGIITNMYSYTALLLVILTYGMETTFFRYANKQDEDPKTVYSTTLISVGFTSILFVGLVLAFISPISNCMGYAAHPEYIGIMAGCVALDAFQAIPFAYLRYKKRPIKFAALKLLFIFMNITLNIIYFVVLPALYKTHPDIIGHIYNPNTGVGYAFSLNLVCTASITFFFIPELKGFHYRFDKALMRRMLSYSWPILILGIAGILNQTADKILFPFIYTAADAHKQLGIYGAASKIAMIMAMITQAFRYAYEPFVFGKSRDKDSKDTYAKAMKYFVIFTLLAFLVVMAYMDILKFIIARDYWDGLQVVPIVMAAEIMMGIYFNLSFWYKLIDKTIWGAYFSGVGCFVLIAINFIFVPHFGYIACAWGGFAGYGTAMLLSYFIGQKKFPINYPLKGILGYIALAGILFALGSLVPISSAAIRIAFRTVLLAIFVAAILHFEHFSFLHRKKVA